MLQAKTAEFKSILKSGKALHELLPEAFAVVREASRRVLGMRHFDVQLVRPVCHRPWTFLPLPSGLSARPPPSPTRYSP